MGGFLNGLFGSQKPKEPRITPAEVGKAMAVSATDYQSFVEDFARHGNVNEIEAWGLHIFCVAFGMKLATNGRLSSGGEQELFENFYRATYEIATHAFKLDDDGYPAFVAWITQKNKEYDPHAQRYFFRGDKNEFDFGSTIVKNLLGREKDVHASLQAFHPAIARIMSTAKTLKNLQFQV
jgi:hypothetical protein